MKLNSKLHICRFYNSFLYRICFKLPLFLLIPFCASAEESTKVAENPEEIAVLDTSTFIQERGISDFPSSPLALPKTKNSFLAVSLSCLVPGLGHVYLGETATAYTLFGNVSLGIGGAVLAPSQEFVQTTSALVIETSWFYGIYAAYRDVRKHNKQIGYSYQMPADSFLDLTVAPFNPTVLKKTEVWGGLLGSLALAFCTAYFLSSGEEQNSPVCSLNTILSPLTAFPVGIGEESFFRGFIQSQFSEWLSPWGGICLSSILFGLAHMPNAWGQKSRERREYYKLVIPFITLSGIYDGWLTYKNHSLKESVALHAWYDFILFAIGAVASDSVIKVRPEFAFSIPF